MFSILVSANNGRWETDQITFMDAGRFKEFSGDEADWITHKDPESLKSLESVPALLMYELAVTGPNSDLVRYGFLRDIRCTGLKIVFKFESHGYLPRSLVEDWEDRLQMHRFEHNREHWAIKDGDIPAALLDELASTPSEADKYDVALSFAGEDRAYGEQVAGYLRSRDVKVFYDLYEEASLWGKDLAEHLDMVYRTAKYCVMFISEHYAGKVWPSHERRAALARSLEERDEYILPARFDETDVPGIRPTIGYINLSHKSPEQLGQLILKKLRG